MVCLKKKLIGNLSATKDLPQVFTNGVDKRRFQGVPIVVLQDLPATMYNLDIRQLYSNYVLIAMHFRYLCIVGVRDRPLLPPAHSLLLHRKASDCYQAHGHEKHRLHLQLKR